MTDDTETRQELATVSDGGSDQMLMDPGTFEHAQRVAKLFANSQLVPKHLQGKPADCFMALHMARRMREDPLMVCQNIVIIQGTAGWKAQWLIARANQMGAFSTRIKYRTEGSREPIAITRRQKDNNGNWSTVDAEVPDIAVTAYARDEDGDEVSYRVSMHDAINEGWTSNPKYSSIPELMLSYRAASFLVRLHCPEVSMGYQTVEELEDMQAAGKLRDVTPRQEQGSATDALSRLGQSTDESVPFQAETPNVLSGANAGAQPPMDAPQQSAEEAEQQPAPEAEGALNVGTGEPDAPSEEERAQSKSVPLRGPHGDSVGEYQRQGHWLNALMKLIRQYEGDPEAVRAIANANRSVFTRIHEGGAHDQRIKEAQELVDRMSVIREQSGDEATDDWLSDYDNASADNASTDDALLGQVQDGLEEAVAAGEVENIRARISIAQKISDEGIRQDALDELDDALTRAQGGSE